MVSSPSGPRHAALARGEITSLQTVSIPTVNSARPEAFARAQVATSEGKKLHRRPFYWRAIGERDADGTYLPGPWVQWRPERTRGERRLIKRERERERPEESTEQPAAREWILSAICMLKLGALKNPQRDICILFTVICGGQSRNDRSACRDESCQNKVPGSRSTDLPPRRRRSSVST